MDVEPIQYVHALANAQCTQSSPVRYVHYIENCCGKVCLPEPTLFSVSNKIEI